MEIDLRRLSIRFASSRLQAAVYALAILRLGIVLCATTIMPRAQSESDSDATMEPVFVRDLIRVEGETYQPGNWIEHRSGRGWSGVHSDAEALLLTASNPRPILSAPEVVELAEEVGKTEYSIDDWQLWIDKVDAPRVEATLDLVRAALPPKIRFRAIFEELDARGVVTKTLMQVDDYLQHGMTRLFRDITQTTRLGGYYVDTRNGSVTRNAVVTAECTGHALAIRPRFLLRPIRNKQPQRILVDCVARTAAPHPLERSQPDSLASIQRDSRSIDEHGSAVAAESGQSQRFEWTTRQGQRLRVTWKAEWTEFRQQEHETFGLLSCVPSDKVALSFELDDLNSLEDAGIGHARSTRSSAPEFDAYSEPETRAARSTVFHIAPPGDEERMRARRLAEVFTASITRSTHCTVRVYDVPSGLATSDVARSQQSPIFIASGTLMPRTSSRFSSYFECPLVYAWQVDDGPVRAIEPVIRNARIGTRLSTKWIPGHKQQPAEVQLDLRLTQLDAIHEATAILNVGTPQRVTPGKEGLPDSIAIDKAIIRKLRIHSTLLIGPDGRGVSRRSATRFLGEGRDILVVAELKDAAK